MAEAAAAEAAAAEATTLAAIGNILNNVGAVAGAIVAVDDDLGAEVDAVVTPPLAPGTTTTWPLRPQRRRPTMPPTGWQWWWVR